MSVAVLKMVNLKQMYQIRREVYAANTLEDRNRSSKFEFKKCPIHQLYTVQSTLKGEQKSST